MEAAWNGRASGYGGGGGSRRVMGWYGMGSRATGVASYFPGAGTARKEAPWSQNVKPAAKPPARAPYGPQANKRTAYDPNWMKLA